jgi:hypothetical protein
MKNFPKTLRHSSQAQMHLEPSRLLLVFKVPPSARDLDEALSRIGMVIESAQPGAPGRITERINHTNTRFWVRSTNDKPISDASYREVEAAFPGTLEFISAVYRLSEAPVRGGMASPLANVILIKEAARTPEGGRDNGLAAVIAEARLVEVTEKSKYLGGYRYFLLPEPKQENAYQIRERLAKTHQAIEVEFETMPMVLPITSTPNDPLYFRQWDMVKIDAPNGWDIATGAGAVICVLDTGCDLTHPDIAFASSGINLATMLPPGSPDFGPENGHGTCCAGIAAATIDNAKGVAGVAGRAKVMPAAFQNWTDVEVASGINYAAVHGARVITMSFGVYAPGDGFFPAPGWNFAMIDAAIANAVNFHNVVLCAATGNENTGVINRYPARNPLVIACGGSDQSDNRKRPASPDGECWGASYGPGISVVAPAVLVATTDIQGSGGFNSNNGGLFFGPCVTYPVCGDLAGDYFFEFNGTSAATPHVAGLAALLASAYPSLTSVQISRLIERTAAKVGTGAYVESPGFPNGTRTQEMGYGRIDVFHALNFADVMIRDWSGDTGAEPSMPPGGDYWDFSDIVVRPVDDGLFLPDVPGFSDHIVSGQANYIYVRVHNLGPHAARNAIVHLRVVPNQGVPFVYPVDWTLVDGTHVSPAANTGAFAAIAAGGSVIAKFRLTKSETHRISEWVKTMNAQPSLLAVVVSDNDYAFASAPGGPNLVQARNNLAQRNAKVIHHYRHEEPELAERDHHAQVEFTINVKVRGHETQIELPFGH